MWTIYSNDVIKLMLAILIFLSGSITIARKTKNLKKIIAIGLLGFLILSIALFLNGYIAKYRDVEAANTKKYTKAQLLSDFSSLEKYIFKENPLAFSDKNKLKKLFNITKDNIKDGMTEEEFYRLINPIVVSVKCGHTNLSISEALVENRKTTAKFFPFEITIKDNKIIAAENTLYGIKAGDEILSINGNLSHKIIERLVQNISHDGNNTNVAHYIAGKHFNNKYYDFVEQADTFKVVLQNKDRKKYSTEAKAEFVEDYNTTAWQLHFDDYKFVDYYSYKINDTEAVLTVRVFLQGEEKFTDFLKRFFTEVHENNINELTIDLRGNFGGRPDMSEELLSYLISKETQYFTEDTELPFLYKYMQGIEKIITPKQNGFDGKTTLLVDGGCFSTCGHFCAVFKQNKLGSIHGSETGGGAVCTDGSQNAILRNTGLRLHYSTHVYKVEAADSMKNEVCGDY